MFYRRNISFLSVLTTAFVILSDVILKVGALKCYKCLADNCEKGPEHHSKTSEVQCTESQVCMKVHYKMFDNVTHYDSIIRTCSDSCIATSEEEFAKCVKPPFHSKQPKYLIGGCVLRKCCSDKDLCNSSTNAQINSWAIILCLLLTNNFNVWKMITS